MRGCSVPGVDEKATDELDLPGRPCNMMAQAEYDSYRSLCSEVRRMMVRKSLV